MINLIMAAFFYVVNDPFFWPAMAFTSLTGIFVGAVVHDGDVGQVKRTLISISSYMALIITVNLSRILPKLDINTITSPLVSQPFASTETLIFVTVFYLFGIWLGVRLVRRAHRK